jgi:hypothetical protein
LAQPKEASQDVQEATAPERRLPVHEMLRRVEVAEEEVVQGDETMNDVMALLERVKEVAFYVVMNSDGQFFRSKGYGGYGKSWVNDLSTARIYAKIGPARSRVLFWANYSPEYPPPKLIKLSFGSVEIIDEKERVEKAKEKKKNQRETARLWAIKQKLKRAQEDFERAKKELEQLKGASI